MARKAVAATLASVLLFTALVVADSTMMTAEDNLLSSAQVAHIASREWLLGQSLEGSSALQLVAQVEQYLASNPAACSDMRRYFDSFSARYSSSGEDSGISYVSKAVAIQAPVSAPRAPDNLTIVAPFSGYVPGNLNLLASLHVSETGGGGMILRQKQEVHFLHVAILPDPALSLCSVALGSLQGALTASRCNATLAARAFGSTLSSLAREAASEGFGLAAGWGFAVGGGGSGGGGCSMTYWLTLVQPGVEGVTGRFDWVVRGAGATA
jgi:hypothetical protein